MIDPKYRFVTGEQSPAHWLTWTNRGKDCVLMTSVWDFLALPEAPKLLKKCGGKLCTMLKRIATRKRVLGPKRFTKCRELAKLLGYQGREAEGEYAYHGIPAMARLLLTLSQESPAIKERFTAVSDVTRFCNVMALASE